MSGFPHTSLLDRIQSPADLKTRSGAQPVELSRELREETMSDGSGTGDHLGASLASTIRDKGRRR